MVVGLPTEAEWEKAARGGHQLPAELVLLDVNAAARAWAGETAAIALLPNPAPGRMYPWGNVFDADRANVGGIGRTSAVGCFPSGASPVGCEDMAGNVLEWTCSGWQENLHPQTGQVQAEAEEMIVHGGTFDGHPDQARCAWRVADLPGDRYYFSGFRVVLRWAPVFDAPAAGPSGL